MSSPRIFFISPDINSPTGGIKQLYRQVDVLNNNGFNAFILHQNAEFKCTWFVNETKVAYSNIIHNQMNSLILPNAANGLLAKTKQFIKTTIKKVKQLQQSTKNDITIQPDDIFVFPEVYGPLIGNLVAGNRKVIYNQGAYQTFFHYDLNLKSNDSPYLNPELIATIVNSENAKEYIQHAFPKMNVNRVRYGIDAKNFYPKSDKKRKIAFMPRRLRVDLLQVINILKFRGLLDNWELVEIHNMNEAQVAENLRDCALFLSFNINEGFGMPPAEAMACGCIVVGYSGKGGIEFFKEDFCYPIDDRDVLSFAKTLENVIQQYEKDSSPFIEKGKKASEFILTEYSMEMEVKTIVECWKNIL